jgi:hypothetical protein
MADAALKHEPTGACAAWRRMVRSITEIQGSEEYADLCLCAGAVPQFLPSSGRLGS